MACSVCRRDDNRGWYCHVRDRRYETQKEVPFCLNPILQANCGNELLQEQSRESGLGGQAYPSHDSPITVGILGVMAPRRGGGHQHG